MTVDTLIVLQARMGSSRLPGKVLSDLGGMPMLEFQLRRLVPVTSVLDATIVVATSEHERDDPVAELAAGLDIRTIRGPEADVLGRFAIASESIPSETIVRLTGDCPLTDPSLVAETVSLHRAAAADYTSNVLPRSYPKGLDVEVCSADVLNRAAAEATAPFEREHVTPFLYRRPDRFRLANLFSGEDLGRERWTVDTADDIARVRGIVERLADPVGIGWREILTEVGREFTASEGELWLRPVGAETPGQCPWVRTWAAEVDGREVGSVSVESGAGEPSFDYLVPAVRLDEARAALTDLLVGDQQIRTD
ncbi:MAG: glycosyltransferase family protein [Acidimicrobiales bacterium]|nr:glycosyltransferase family protein [Acidimicrobiales bacterium]